MKFLVASVLLCVSLIPAVAWPNRVKLGTSPPDGYDMRSRESYVLSVLPKSTK